MTIHYRGYTIRQEEVYYQMKYKFFPIGNEDDDADYDYECGRYYYTGNGKWVDSIEEAKDAIDEEYAIDTYYRVDNPVTRTITKFRLWLQAKSFCDSVGLDVMHIRLYFNGEEYNFDSI